MSSLFSGAGGGLLATKYLSWLYEVKKLVRSAQTANWCRLPYPGHLKGCPNYGKTTKCPPQAPTVEEFFDLSKPLYIVHSEFNVLIHMCKMKQQHPQWSDRQCRCVLYWQPKSRKQLKERIKIAHAYLGTNTDTSCPEAMGVNVYATARVSGLKLEKVRELSICRHVALLGWKIN